MTLYIFSTRKVISMLSMVLGVWCSVAALDKAYPGEQTYFPLLPGSYWVYQDSFFTEGSYEVALEMTDGQAAVLVLTDSVLSCVRTAYGYRVKIKRKRHYKEGRKRPTETTSRFIDSNGVVYVDSCMTQAIAKLQPILYDTLTRLQISQSVFVQRDTVLNVFTMKNLSSKVKSIYKQGIGETNTVYDIRSSNLIEYRIGKGPVVKKHWVMEQPVENR